MSDIVEELRSRTTGIVLLSDPPQFQKDGLCQRAADEIERLREEVEALKSEESCNDVLLEYAQAENERLRGENARLRETLQYIADPYNNSTTSKDRLAFLARAAIREGGDKC